MVVVSPSQQQAVSEIRLSGSLVAARRASLSPRVDGLVEQVLVDAGAKVDAGALLLKLDASLEQFELARLAANLEEASADADESQRLVDEAQRLTRDNHLPKTELALRQAALAAAKARLEAARAARSVQRQRVQWHQLPAPFAGVIVDKMTESGEWVTRGTPVLELVATEDLYLDVQVPQSQYGALSENTQVVIRPDISSQETVPARIEAQVPVADSVSRTFRVRLVATEPHPALLPGASATAIFTLTNQDQSVTMVPRDAILRNPDGGFSLFTVEEREGQLLARRQRVTLGRESGSEVAVLSGLPTQARVVIRGNEVLRNDQPVKLVAPTNP